MERTPRPPWQSVSPLLLFADNLVSHCMKSPSDRGRGLCSDSLQKEKGQSLRSSLIGWLVSHTHALANRVADGRAMVGLCLSRGPFLWLYGLEGLQTVTNIVSSQPHGFKMGYFDLGKRMLRRVHPEIVRRSSANKRNNARKTEDSVLMFERGTSLIPLKSP